jgi:hypothetical protein
MGMSQNFEQTIFVWNTVIGLIAVIEGRPLLWVLIWLAATAVHSRLKVCTFQSDKPTRYALLLK